MKLMLKSMFLLGLVFMQVPLKAKKLEEPACHSVENGVAPGALLVARTFFATTGTLAAYSACRMASHSLVHGIYALMISGFFGSPNFKKYPLLNMHAPMDVVLGHFFNFGLGACVCGAYAWQAFKIAFDSNLVNSGDMSDLLVCSGQE